MAKTDIEEIRKSRRKGQKIEQEIAKLDGTSTAEKLKLEDLNFELETEKRRVVLLENKIEIKLQTLQQAVDQSKGVSIEKTIKSVEEFRDRTYPESEPMKRYQREALTAYIDFLNDKK